MAFAELQRFVAASRLEVSVHQRAVSADIWAQKTSMRSCLTVLGSGRWRESKIRTLFSDALACITLVRMQSSLSCSIECD